MDLDWRIIYFLELGITGLFWSWIIHRMELKSIELENS